MRSAQCCTAASPLVGCLIEAHLGTRSVHFVAGAPNGTNPYSTDPTEPNHHRSPLRHAGRPGHRHGAPHRKVLCQAVRCRFGPRSEVDADSLAFPIAIARRLWPRRSADFLRRFDDLFGLRRRNAFGCPRSVAFEVLRHRSDMGQSPGPDNENQPRRPCRAARPAPSCWP